MIDMDVLKLFETACQELVKTDPKFMKDGLELLTFAKNHERRYVCLVNVCDQVRQYERRNRFRSKTKVTAKGRYMIIAASAQLFLGAIKEQRDQQNWSEATKILKANGDSLKRDVAEILKEV